MSVVLAACFPQDRAACLGHEQAADEVEDGGSDQECVFRWNVITDSGGR
jgi:hypothetical protein